MTVSFTNDLRLNIPPQPAQLAATPAVTSPKRKAVASDVETKPKKSDVEKKKAPKHKAPPIKEKKPPKAKAAGKDPTIKAATTRSAF